MSLNDILVYVDGAEATKAFLTRNHIDASKIVIVDGSGLSRENRVTSRKVDARR